MTSAGVKAFSRAYKIVCTRFILFVIVFYVTISHYFLRQQCFSESHFIFDPNSVLIYHVIQTRQFDLQIRNVFIRPWKFDNPYWSSQHIILSIAMALAAVLLSGERQLHGESWAVVFPLVLISVSVPAFLMKIIHAAKAHEINRKTCKERGKDEQSKYHKYDKGNTLLISMQNLSLQCVNFFVFCTDYSVYVILKQYRSLNELQALLVVNR